MFQSVKLPPFFRNPRSDAKGSPSLFLLMFHNSCQNGAVSSDDDRSFLFPRYNMLCFALQIDANVILKTYGIDLACARDVGIDPWV